MGNEFVVYDGPIECLVGSFDGVRIHYTGPRLNSYIGKTLKSLTKDNYKLNRIGKKHGKVRP